MHSRDEDIKLVPVAYCSTYMLPLFAGAQAVLYASTSPHATGSTYYHNVLGVTPSSKASYDPISAAEHYELSIEIMERHLGKVEKVRAAAVPAADGILIIGTQ